MANKKKKNPPPLLRGFFLDAAYAHYLESENDITRRKIQKHINLHK